MKECAAIRLIGIRQHNAKEKQSGKGVNQTPEGLRTLQSKTPIQARLNNVKRPPQILTCQMYKVYSRTHVA